MKETDGQKEGKKGLISFWDERGRGVKNGEVTAVAVAAGRKGVIKCIYKHVSIVTNW